MGSDRLSGGLAASMGSDRLAASMYTITLMGWANQPIRVRDITEAVKSQSANISPS
jgi:hypothetical protein